MIRVELPKLDLNEVPTEQHSQALLRQLQVLIEQINVSLDAIGTDDITLSDGRTLSDFLGLSKK